MILFLNLHLRIGDVSMLLMCNCVLNLFFFLSFIPTERYDLTYTTPNKFQSRWLGGWTLKVNTLLHHFSYLQGFLHLIDSLANIIYCLNCYRVSPFAFLMLFKSTIIIAILIPFKLSPCDLQILTVTGFMLSELVFYCYFNIWVYFCSFYNLICPPMLLGSWQV